MSDAAPDRDHDPFPVPVPPEAREPEPAVVGPNATGGNAPKAKDDDDDLRAVPTRKSPPRKSAPKAAPRAAQPAQPADAKLRREALKALKRWRAEIGVGGLYVMPLPATYVARTPDDVLDAAVDLAARNTKVLAALAGGGDALSALVVLRWLAGLGVAVGVQTGRLAGDSIIAESFGMGELIDDLAAKGFVSVEPIEPDSRPPADDQEIRSEDDASAAGPDLFGSGNAAAPVVGVL